MGTGVVYVMTHDSIGLGEDGPTHQPVEHLAALRAMPNMRVFRPCDAVETSEAWELALARTDGPTILVLTRQNLEQQRLVDSRSNKLATGAYELAAGTGGPAVATLFASGSEDRDRHGGAYPACRKGHFRAGRFGAIAGTVPAAAG